MFLRSIEDTRNRETPCLFVNIRLVEGRSQQLKHEMSKRVIAAISDVLQLPEHDIWIVFEDVPAGDWYVGGSSSLTLRL